MEGSSETLESTPLTLPLGKLALENKGALEVAGTVMPWPISWAMFPLSLGLQRLVERGEPIPALQVACTLWHKLAEWTGQEKFTIHCGTLFRDTIRKSKSGRSCLSQTKSEPRSSRPKEPSLMAIGATERSACRPFSVPKHQGPRGLGRRPQRNKSTLRTLSGSP